MGAAGAAAGGATATGAESNDGGAGGSSTCGAVAGAAAKGGASVAADPSTAGVGPFCTTEYAPYRMVPKSTSTTRGLIASMESDSRSRRLDDFDRVAMCTGFL
jgi:hypothetical protein